jgi:predicted Zn-dependent protease
VIGSLDGVSQQNGGTGHHMQAAIGDSLKNELASALALQEKRPADAERFAAESVRHEAAMEFPSGPPDVIKPAYEFYGETLLALNKPAQAAEQFSIELQRMPKRALSVLGLARARTALKENADATKAYGELAQIWAYADADLPAVQEVRSKTTASRP